MITYKISRDINGNKTIRIQAPGRRGFSIQTNGNLPNTHRNGVTAMTDGEVRNWIDQHGTEHQKAIMALNADVNSAVNQLRNQLTPNA